MYKYLFNMKTIHLMCVCVDFVYQECTQMPYPTFIILDSSDAEN